jgi:hypothetical protein
MGDTGGGRGVGGKCHSGALVNERTRNLEIQGLSFARPGMTRRMAGNSKFALAERPEPRYTA